MFPSLLVAPFQPALVVVVCIDLYVLNFDHIALHVKSTVIS